MKHQLFTQNLLKYIPSLVIKHNIEKGNKNRILPEVQPLETVVMFSDISGFTSISEACSKRGARGAEELVFCINRYMEGLVKCIGKYGGDIIKFVGDAMIVVYPRKEDEDLTIIVRRAIQTGLEIQSELNNKRIMQNVSRLSVKIGLGVGKCGLLHVGGIFDRTEFFAVGEALSQALESEHACTHGGQVIISAAGWNLVKQFFVGSEVGEHGGHYEIKELVGVGVRSTGDASEMRAQYEPDKIEKIQHQLRCYVPAAITPYLELNIESYGAETRRLTIMFASLGVDLSNTQTEAGLQRIQQVVTTVQKAVYQMEGSVNKLVMDDKGSTLICIWGLPPLAHEDDAARAVTCAQLMRRNLLAGNLKCDCNIGISTGIVFAGVVGTSGSRREYSVIGDVVNLAARIMAWPKYNNEGLGKIYVDLKTKEDASNKFRFSYHTHASFKGKSLKLPIYEPLEQDQSLEGALLPIHANPFLVDHRSLYSFEEKVSMFGRNTLLKTALNDFARSVGVHMDNSKIFIIEGPPGSGKSLFARHLIMGIQEADKKGEYGHWANNSKIEIYTSAVGSSPLNDKLYLNGWRSILRSISQVMATKQNKDRGLILEQIATQKENLQMKDKLFLIESLFGVKMPNGYLPESQLKIPDDPYRFVKKENYSEEITEIVIKFILELFKILLSEEGSDIESESEKSVDSKSNHSGETGKNSALSKQKHIKKPPPVKEIIPPIVLFLDDVSKMDQESWKLLDELQENLTKLIVYVIIRHNTEGEFYFDIKDMKKYFEILEENKAFSEHYEVSRIDEIYLDNICEAYLGRYKAEIEKEIIAMTQGEDAKTVEVKRNELKDHYGIAEEISGLDKEAQKAIYRKAEGNILVSMQLIVNLIKNKYLENINGIFTGSIAFWKTAELDEWGSVETPDFALRLNSERIDKTLKSSNIKDIVSLKAASALGPIFSLRALKAISPLRSEGMVDLLKRMRQLEEANIIEIIDDNGVSDMTCRFLIPFYRETLYQKLLYRDQKKALHSIAAEYILNNSTSIDDNPEKEVQRMVNHLIITEDVNEQQELSVKNKRRIVIKKISNLLLKDVKIIKMGTLRKQGDNLNKKIEDRFVVVTKDELQYYHSEQEFKIHDALGIIYLKNIGSVVPYERSTSANMFEFVVDASSWMKKDIVKEHREFYFAANSEEERDEWITTIELQKAVAVNKNFQNSFGAKVGGPREDPIVNLFDKKLSLSLTAPALKSNAGSPESKLSPKQRRETIRGLGLNMNSLNQNSPHRKEQDLKEKIKVMFNYMFCHFTGHLMEHAFKSKRDDRRELTKTPKILVECDLLGNIEKKFPILTDMQPERSSFFSGGSSNSLPESSPKVRSASQFNLSLMKINEKLQEGKENSEEIKEKPDSKTENELKSQKEKLNSESESKEDHKEDIMIANPSDENQKEKKNSVKAEDEESHGEVDESVVQSDKEEDEQLKGGKKAINDSLAGSTATKNAADGLAKLRRESTRSEHNNNALGSNTAAYPASILPSAIQNIAPRHSKLERKSAISGEPPSIITGLNQAIPQEQQESESQALKQVPRQKFSEFVPRTISMDTSQNKSKKPEYRKMSSKTVAAIEKKGIEIAEEMKHDEGVMPEVKLLADKKSEEKEKNSEENKKKNDESFSPLIKLSSSAGKAIMRSPYHQFKELLHPMHSPTLFATPIKSEPNDIPLLKRRPNYAMKFGTEKSIVEIQKEEQQMKAFAGNSFNSPSSILKSSLSDVRGIQTSYSSPISANVNTELIMQKVKEFIIEKCLPETVLAQSQVVGAPTGMAKRKGKKKFKQIARAATSVMIMKNKQKKRGVETEQQDVGNKFSPQESIEKKQEKIKEKINNKLFATAESKHRGNLPSSTSIKAKSGMLFVSAGNETTKSAIPGHKGGKLGNFDKEEVGSIKSFNLSECQENNVSRGGNTNNIEDESVMSPIYGREDDMEEEKNEYEGGIIPEGQGADNITASPTQYLVGFVKKSITSMGGDIFDLEENTVVYVEKINEEDNLATCTYKGMTGLFPLDAIKIAKKKTETEYQADKLN